MKDSTHDYIVWMLIFFLIGVIFGLALLGEV
jgi:hypothetical protein